MDLSRSQFLPILLNLVAAVVGASGQYLYKIGGNQIGLVPIYRNWQLFGGMILFCLVMFLFVVGFKLGGKLSVVYPMYATTFIWGTLIAIAWGKESWSWGQLVGIALIVLGVSCVAIFSPKPESSSTESSSKNL